MSSFGRGWFTSEVQVLLHQRHGVRRHQRGDARDHGLHRAVRERQVGRQRDEEEEEREEREEEVVRELRGAVGDGVLLELLRRSAARTRARSDTSSLEPACILPPWVWWQSGTLPGVGRAGERASAAARRAGPSTRRPLGAGSCRAVGRRRVRTSLEMRLRSDQMPSARADSQRQSAAAEATPGQGAAQEGQPVRGGGAAVLEVGSVHRVGLAAGGGLPGVVVGGHGHQRVVQLRLAGEPGLRHRLSCRSDPPPQRAVHAALGARAQRGALDADVGAVTVHLLGPLSWAASDSTCRSVSQKGSVISRAPPHRHRRCRAAGRSGR